MTLARLAALSVSALALTGQPAFADYTLNILHINDWHSRIESNNKYESTCSAEEEGKNECFGGAARLVTAFNQERQKLEGQNVLALNAGDNFQGSLFYTTFKGAAELEFLNQIRFDAMTVGNHEFDDGENALAPFLDKVGFPVLGANVKANAQSKLGDRVKPSAVVEIGGQRIGIIGVVTTDTPDIASPGPNLSFSDDVEAIKAEVAKLEGEGVNKIIALTHVGYERDKDAIARIPGVDVVVGGHSHTLLSNADPKAEGPYPTFADGANGVKVPVVTAASYSKLLGELKVVFDDNGVVKEATGNPIVLDSTIKPDEAVLARVKEMGAPIEALKARVVGEARAPIDGSRETCRAQECAMGDLIADAMLDRTKGQGVTIALQNGGGVRASIDEGPITMGEVLTVLPFQNTLATFQLSGADLVSSLEAGVSAIDEGKGKFPQVAGLRFKLDTSKPANSGRVSGVEVQENGNWGPIDPAKTYTIATNNFTRNGGDDYELFKNNARNAYDFGASLEQVVADYLGANRPYEPRTDGRIQLVSQTAQAEPAPATLPPSSEVAPSQNTPPATAEPTPAPSTPAPSANEPAAQDSQPSEPATANPPATPAPADPANPAVSEPAEQDSQPSEPATGVEPSPTPANPAANAPAGAAPANEAPLNEAPAGTASQTGARSHVIARGDTYWDLAKSLYGDATLWRRIADANPEYRARALPVGATLNVPAAN
ncbi:5'-nucleotidase C-terminal domain-containing protein [Mesorhizobium sp. RP14(2022)]|uniref:5'-nucleotidase C-terminal domain-containing protein n=1 Tax=Mesorhizobium liriopis TaxID=2953882 RepID=A0ABT1C214_9HYPH|nr:5'-nucleotidase C-terminal domain-containing protein [Mesorhizobium liriopis]MCO6048802.1 5'-nucleotidase C-terminal domain-containing protein [Mesorhizobium liriopis]